jgi:hypothetical protein
MNASTLQDRARAATAIADREARAKGDDLLAGSIEKLAQTIVEEAERARGINAAAVEFGVRSDDRLLKSAKDALRKATRGVITDPASSTLTKAEDAVRFLRSTVEAQHELVRSAWRAHRETHPSPGIDRSYLEQLATAGFSIGSIEARVEQLDTRLMLLREKNVPSPGDREAWDAAVRELSDVVAELSGLAPPEVRDFLSAAVAGGAPLTLLTDAVTDFLATHGLSASFRVVRK